MFLYYIPFCSLSSYYKNVFQMRFWLYNIIRTRVVGSFIIAQHILASEMCLLLFKIFLEVFLNRNKQIIKSQSGWVGSELKIQVICRKNIWIDFLLCNFFWGKCMEKYSWNKFSLPNIILTICFAPLLFAYQVVYIYFDTWALRIFLGIYFLYLLYS